MPVRFDLTPQPPAPASNRMLPGRNENAGLIPRLPKQVSTLLGQSPNELGRLVHEKLSDAVNQKNHSSVIALMYLCSLGTRAALVPLLSRLPELSLLDMPIIPRLTDASADPEVSRSPESRTVPRFSDNQIAEKRAQVLKQMNADTKGKIVDVLYQSQDYYENHLDAIPDKLLIQLKKASLNILKVYKIPAPEQIESLETKTDLNQWFQRLIDLCAENKNRTTPSTSSPNASISNSTLNPSLKSSLAHVSDKKLQAVSLGLYAVLQEYKHATGAENSAEEVRNQIEGKAIDLTDIFWNDAHRVKYSDDLYALPLEAVEFAPNKSHVSQKLLQLQLKYARALNVDQGDAAVIQLQQVRDLVKHYPIKLNDFKNTSELSKSDHSYYKNNEEYPDNIYQVFVDLVGEMQGKSAVDQKHSFHHGAVECKGFVEASSKIWSGKHSEKYAFQGLIENTQRVGQVIPQVNEQTDARLMSQLPNARKVNWLAIPTESLKENNLSKVIAPAEFKLALKEALTGFLNARVRAGEHRQPLEIRTGVLAENKNSDHVFVSILTQLIAAKAVDVNKIVFHGEIPKTIFLKAAHVLESFLLEKGNPREYKNIAAFGDDMYRFLVDHAFIKND